MHFGAQMQAAIEVMNDIQDRHRPAGDALGDWGRAHRFAGSGDRAVIGNLVFDCLRKRRSLAARLGDEAVRLAIPGVAVFHWGRSVDQVAEACCHVHGPGALSEADRAALAKPEAGDPENSAQGDYPDWLEPSLARAFGADLGVQTAALSERAPVDLRVNGLKADRAKVARALARFAPTETPWSPWGLRIAAPQAEKRYPNVETEAAHGKGWFEVQDEGSQVAALLAGAARGMQVLDMCAGAGGKSLALASAMENKGQIWAYDADRSRLRKIFDRLKRAGARNVQVIEAGNETAVQALEGRMDVVFIDAPCTGTGTWRRRPDAKWRLTAQALERRQGEQRDILRAGAPLTRPGGRLVYVTCSLLPEENQDQVASFLQDNPDYRLVPYQTVLPDALTAALPASCGEDARTLMMTPHAHGTDGFYIAVMERGDAP